MTTQDAIQRFCALAAAGGFKGLRINAFGLTRDDQCLNLISRAVLELHPPERGWSSNFRVGPYSLHRYWWPFRDTNELLEALASQEIRLASERLRLERADGSAYHWDETPVCGWARRATRWPSHALRGAGDSVSSTAGNQQLSAIEPKLLALTSGRFGNIDQLLRYSGEPYRPFEYRGLDSSTCDVLAPVPARLRRVELVFADHELRVEVETRGASATTRFAVYAVASGVPHPVAFEASQFDSHGDGLHRLVTQIAMPAGPLDVHLQVGDFTVDTKRVGLPRPGSLAHSYFDIDGKWLEGLLEQPLKRRGSSEFERYVVALLNLCGLPAVWYGSKSMDHAPDIVAEVDDDSVVICECKVIPPTTEMLETLESRRRALLESAWGVQQLNVHAAYFCPARKETIAPDVIRYASQYGIVIHGLEQLHQLHAHWARGESRERLLSYLLGGR